MPQISIAGLNKAAVLAALYNAAKANGMGFLQYDPKPMTPDEADKLLMRTTNFDYLKGRVMKINLSKDLLETGCYDRDNGTDAAKRAIAELVKTGNTNSASIEDTHKMNTLGAVAETWSRLGEKTRVNGQTVSLGLADVADKLGPALERAVRKIRK